MPGAQVKDEKLYRDLRERGDSKEKAARLAHASAASSRGEVAANGGSRPSCTEWTRQDLRKRAKEIGIR